MSNFFGVEENPQINPAECNWGSGDKSVNDRFVRITNPYTETTTLLMGEGFFVQLAEGLGYVKRDVVEEEQRNLRDELRSARDSLDNLALQLGDTRSQLARLDDLEGPLATVRESLGGFETRLNNARRERDEHSHEVREAAESGEPEKSPVDEGSSDPERKSDGPSDADQSEPAKLPGRTVSTRSITNAIDAAKSGAGSGSPKRTSESPSKS